MSEPHERPPTRQAINPFLVPQWENSRRPLCPWKKSTREHKDYYVDVGRSQEAFDAFTRKMSNLAGLQEEGRLVLVIGESGCGKTALINRCAAWVEHEFPEHNRFGQIIDLTRELASGPLRSTDERVIHVCGRLVDELKRSLLLSEEELKYLELNRKQPDLVYPYFGGALDDGVVLIILLPPSDLVEEVIRYAGLARGKLLLFAESSYLDAGKAQDVEHSQQVSPPIVLKVNELLPDDVRRYVMDRLSRHAGNGMFPRMSRETIDQLAASRPRSVAMLQNILIGVYEDRRQRDLRYSDNDWMSYEDITDYFFRTFGKVI